MKRVILLSAFIITLLFLGHSQESRLDKFLVPENGEIPAVLLSHNYLEKSEILNFFQSSEFVSKFKTTNSKIFLDSVVTQAWSDELNLLQNSFKNVYVFENEGRNLLLKIYSWNIELNRWSKTYDLYYYFDNEEKLIRTEFEMYVTSIYKMFTKIEYSYTNRLLTQEAFFTKYEEEEPWIEDGKTAYFYNENNLLIRALTNVWDDYLQTWIDGDKIEYRYNSKGNLTNESGYSWDDYAVEWSQNYSIENSFNLNNHLIESVNYIIEVASGVLEVDTKIVYAYNSNNLAYEILYEWEYDLLIWLEIEKNEYFQPEVGTDTLFKTRGYTWIKNQHSWKNNIQSEFISTNKLLEQDVLYHEYMETYLPFYVFDNIACDLINSYKWIDDKWIKTEITIAYFSSITGIGFDYHAKSKAMIYPNPSTDYLNVELNSLEETRCFVRDINGRTIFQSSIYKNARLNISNFQSGIYFIELQQKGQRFFTSKFIKK